MDLNGAVPRGVQCGPSAAVAAEDGDDRDGGQSERGGRGP